MSRDYVIATHVRGTRTINGTAVVVSEAQWRNGGSSFSVTRDIDRLDLTQHVRGHCFDGPPTDAEIADLLAGAPEPGPRWPLGKHRLTVDPTSDAGRAILDLFTGMKQIEESDGGWPGAGTVNALCSWFGRLGIDVNAPAPAIPRELPKATHDCGLCDGPLVFDGLDSDGLPGWRCNSCGWVHTSKDCCEPVRTLTSEDAGNDEPVGDQPPEQSFRIVNIAAPGGSVYRFRIAGEETLTVEIDGKPTVGVDKDGAGYWPDGETWTRLDTASLPPDADTLDKRAEQAVEAAEPAFWAVIAARFPEVTSGDFAPGDAHALTSAMENAVSTWLLYNHPSNQHDEDPSPTTPEGETTP